MHRTTRIAFGAILTVCVVLAALALLPTPELAADTFEIQNVGCFSCITDCGLILSCHINCANPECINCPCEDPFGCPDLRVSVEEVRHLFQGNHE